MISLSVISCNKFNKKAIKLNNEANDFMVLGEYDKALLLLTEAVKIDKKYYIAYANMATIYSGRKDFDKAIIATENQIKCKPDLGEAWVYAGILYDIIDNPTKAHEYYNNGIEIFEDRISDNIDIKTNKMNLAVALKLVERDKELH